jgi:hypothetical protein
LVDGTCMSFNGTVNDVEWECRSDSVVMGLYFRATVNQTLNNITPSQSINDRDNYTTPVFSQATVHWMQLIQHQYLHYLG